MVFGVKKSFPWHESWSYSYGITLMQYEGLYAPLGCNSFGLANQMGALFFYLRTEINHNFKFI